MQFKELGINGVLLDTIAGLGFSEPTPIQKQSIPILLQGNRDYIGLAQTGTGKTATFGLPLLHLVNTQVQQLQAVILVPTRELCVQVTKELKKFASDMPAMTIVSLYGGVAIESQISHLRYGAHIVVATPGRMVDHITRQTISLNAVRIVVLDEADQMFDKGFQEDLDTILAAASTRRHTWLFSATMSPEVEELAQQHMNDPYKVVIGTANTTAENLEHFYCVVDSRIRYKVLTRFIDYYPKLLAIVFCRTRKETKDLVQQLLADGYSADALHGDLSQAQREAVMIRMRARQLQVLIATDVAARGLDISDVTHVFHYGLPEDIESYTHRSGRTARAGKSGMSIALIPERDVSKMKRIQRIIHAQVTCITIPTGEQIGKKQLESYVHELRDYTVDDQAIASYMPYVLEQLGAFSRTDLLNRIISFNYGALINRYADMPDLNNRSSRDIVRDRDHDARVRLFLTIGSKDGFDKKQLVQFISSKSSVALADIKHVTLERTFSFCEVSQRADAERIMQALNGIAVNNRLVHVEFSNKKKSASVERNNRYTKKRGKK